MSFTSYWTVVINKQNETQRACPQPEFVISQPCRDASHTKFVAVTTIEEIPKVQIKRKNVIYRSLGHTKHLIALTSLR